MTRQDLLSQLDRYLARYSDEAETVGRIRSLLENHERAFHRDCVPGHITSSAWIVSRESRSVLLTHHRKLERWLQLGGHTDGEMDVLASALREAEEESGLLGFAPIPSPSAVSSPFPSPYASGESAPPFEILDVDVHLIPARADEPEHEHHDIRFLLEVSEEQAIERQVAESKEVRWFPAEGIEARFDEESLARMARKASDWLSRTPPRP